MNVTQPLPRVGILVIDDHGIVRDGLTILLERHPGLKVIGTAANGQQGILAAKRLAPDVIIMDLILPDLSGIDATLRILKVLPRTHVIVLSACQTAEHVYRALRAGAHGYVVKDAVSIELVHAVKTAVAGGRYVSARFAALFDDGLAHGLAAKSPLERLSAREREVLCGVVAGSSSAEIAQRLFLSRKTVDTYRARLMVKLGVSNRSALIRFAIEHELARL